MKKIFIIILLVFNLLFVGCEYIDGVSTETSEDIPVATITDSWEQVLESIDDGTYREKYEIGDTMVLDLGSKGVLEMQIAAFDADELADGNGYAAITWISKQLLKTEYRMNPALERNSLDSSQYKLGSGSIGGWKYSEMRAWLKQYVKPLLPETVNNSIKPVIKYSNSYDTLNSNIPNYITVDDIWIPSKIEVFGIEGFSFEYDGPLYTELFDSEVNRIKYISGESIDDTGSDWWLRSSFYSFYWKCSSFDSIRCDGREPIDQSTDPDVEMGVAIGFCI